MKNNKTFVTIFQRLIFSQRLNVGRWQCVWYSDDVRFPDKSRSQLTWRFANGCARISRARWHSHNRAHCTHRHGVGSAVLSAHRAHLAHHRMTIARLRLIRLLSHRRLHRHLYFEKQIFIRPRFFKFFISLIFSGRKSDLYDGWIVWNIIDIVDDPDILDIGAAEENVFINLVLRSYRKLGLPFLRAE